MFPQVQIFESEWITLALFFMVIFTFVGISELARKKLNFSVITTRTFVHIIVGLFTLLCPFLFVSKYPPLVLAVIFVIFNFAIVTFKKLPSLHATEQKSYGTVYFPLAFLILVLFWWERPLTFEIALLLLTFADPAAAIAGRRSRSPEYYTVWKEKKSIQGSIMFYVISILSIGCGTIYLRQLAGLDSVNITIFIPMLIIVSGLATIAESVSSAGSDNLTVPILSAVSYDLFLSCTDHFIVLSLLSWIILSFLFAYIVFRLKSLSRDGALGAFVMGIIIFGIGGWKFMIPMGIYFILSSLLSHFGGKKKEEEQTSLQKGRKRDIEQVYANGGIPLLITIWWFYQPTEWLYMAYLASVAATTADTWGTEIGYLSKRLPRNIINFKQMNHGASGGVTIIGTIASLLGSAVIGFTAIFYIPDLTRIYFIIGAGFVASIIDSILGATVQGIYKCSECGKRVEKPEHCRKNAILVSGIRWINNDLVNIACTISGPILYFLFWFQL
ncbi:MAG: DUF92 domain-containing protein [Candidatus Marinimicrobia bacterium]|nr:DUF92 domain-containing protein [Candidatus Neomarinimicrobiota bacterium]